MTPEPLKSSDLEAELATVATIRPTPLSHSMSDPEKDSHGDELTWKMPFRGVIQDVKRTLLTNYKKELLALNQKVRAKIYNNCVLSDFTLRARM